MHAACLGLAGHNEDVNILDVALNSATNQKPLFARLSNASSALPLAKPGTIHLLLTKQFDRTHSHSYNLDDQTYPPSAHGAYCKNYVATTDYLSQQHIHYTNHMEKNMSTFKLHTIASAPAGSIPILDAANKSLGFIPNLYAHLAESPATLQAYKQLGTLLEQSAFTPEEQQVILVAVSVENRCAYCVAAHSFIARNMVKIPADTITALRSGGTLPNTKLNALATFTRAVVRERGWVADSHELKNFFAAGYTQQQVLEVVLGVSMKTLSNYINHLTDTPLDAAFANEAWIGPDDHGCCKS